MIEFALTIALIIITVLQAFKKWGWLDWYGAHYGHVKWLPDAGCYLCLSLWLSFIIAPLYAIAAIFDLSWIFTPLIVAGITNILLTMHEKV